MITYLKSSQILEIHGTFVTTGDHEGGVRNWGLIAYIPMSVQDVDNHGQELFPGVFQKAAVYMMTLARYQPFNDGNRRTALAAAVVFLHMNGWALTLADPAKFLTEVKDGEWTVAAIALSLQKASSTATAKDFAEAFTWFQRKYAADIPKMGELP